MRRSLRFVPFLALSLAAPLRAQGAMPSMSGGSSPNMDGIRAALDRYKDPLVAVHDGYFSTVACIDFPRAGSAGEMSYPAGAMGVHFLNPGLIGPQLDSLRPQVLIYEPVRDTLRLVAAEWFVPVQVSPTRPRLFGHDLDGPMEGHHPIMAPELHHWDLHVWLWKNNPAGMFSPTNPSVRCPNGAYTIREGPPRMVHQ